MDRTALAKWSAGYALAWIASTVVGLGIAAAGAGLWIWPAYLEYGGGASTAAVARTAAPGAVLALVGLFLWQAGTTAARYWTLTAAAATETAAHLDTEAMKSDILSVLDERLAEMHEDVERTRRLLEREQREEAAESFEFSEGE